MCVCTLDKKFTQNNGKIAIYCSVVVFCLAFVCLKTKQDCVLTMTSLKEKPSLFFCLCSKISILVCVCVGLCMYFMRFFFFSVIIIILIIKKLMYQHSFLVLLLKG